MMSFWYRLLRALGFATPAVRTYHLDNELVGWLQLVAKNERLSEHQVTAELIAEAIARRDAYRELLQRWQALSPREQQVLALVCHHYTTGEIAVQLQISPATVRTHVRHILEKFGIHSRTELCLLLADWKFDASR